MTIYRCEECEFDTKNKTGYTRHCKSTKHLLKKNPINDDEKIPPKTLRKPSVASMNSHTDVAFNNAIQADFSLAIINAVRKDIETQLTRDPEMSYCEYCNTGYTRTDNLKRHESKCSHKTIQQKVTEIANVTEKKNQEIANVKQRKNREIAMYKLRIKNYEEDKEKQEENIYYYKQMILLNGSRNNSNQSSFKHIIQNYTDAEPLRQITFEKFIEMNVIRYIEYSKKPYEEQLVEDIIYCYRHKMLEEYIGSTIIKLYKKADPNCQSIWNTDTSRLKYVTRNTINKNLDRWVVDKHGEYTNKKIVKPILKRLKIILNKYHGKYCNFEDTDSRDDCDKMLRDSVTILEIIDEIDDNKLSKGVLKYMAPHFTIEQLTIDDKNEEKRRKRKDEKKKRKKEEDRKNEENEENEKDMSIGEEKDESIDKINNIKKHKKSKSVTMRKSHSTNKKS